MYDYKICSNEIAALLKDFPLTRAFEIGRSVMGKPIYCIKTGCGERKILLVGAHHGLEYLTSALIMRFLREYLQAFSEEIRLFDTDLTELYQKITLFCVPMLNPDGVDLAIHGIDIKNRFHLSLLRQTGLCLFKRRWQANARGVDINHNYDAAWQPVKKHPCASKYAGVYPESEPETKAMTSLVRQENFDALIAFHSQGGEIYYDFNKKEQHRAKSIAEKMAILSGYTAKSPTGSAAFGGLKDWFISDTGGLGFTVEIGRGKNPLPLSLLEKTATENIPVILCLMREISEKK